MDHILFFRYLQIFGGILAICFGGLWVATDTPERRAANEKAWFQIEIEKQKTKQAEELTKQIELTGGQRPSLSVLDIPAQSSNIRYVNDTYLAKKGKPFMVNWESSSTPAGKIYFSDVPSAISGNYKLVVMGQPNLAVWSQGWSAEPSGDVDAFIKRVAEEKLWVEIYTRGPSNFKM